MFLQNFVLKYQNCIKNNYKNKRFSFLVQRNTFQLGIGKPENILTLF